MAGNNEVALPAEGGNGYIASLDGIRALAVMLVVFFHWPGDHLRLHGGWIGVQIFFVLSGFLITRILLEEKKKPLKEYLSRFYVRRSLRIFPIYYLYLLFLGLAYYGVKSISSGTNGFLQYMAGIEDNWGYLYTYTYNFMQIGNRMLGISYTNPRAVTHLWSLSVEEQFYLFFPMIVYFLSARTLQKAALGIIIGIPVLRGIAGYFLLSMQPDVWWAGRVLYRNSLLQLDSFAFGILLALPFFKKYYTMLTAPKVLFTALAVSIAIALGDAFLIGEDTLWSGLGFDNPERQTYFHRHMYRFSLINLCAMLLIAHSVAGRPLLKIFENKYLIYIGRISYGIYLYHVLLKAITLEMLFRVFGRESVLHNYFFESISFILYLAIVFIISHLSFRYIETPFLRLKERYSERKISG